jgi:hypothetical protein
LGGNSILLSRSDCSFPFLAKFRVPEDDEIVFPTSPGEVLIIGGILCDGWSARPPFAKEVVRATCAAPTGIPSDNSSEVNQRGCPGGMGFLSIKPCGGEDTLSIVFVAGGTVFVVARCVSSRGYRPI